MWKRAQGVEIFAPLIRNGRAHEAFFQARIIPGRGTCMAKLAEPDYSPAGSKPPLDDSLYPLFDYGYYPAGIEAKKAYLHLMNHWRQASRLPKILLGEPPAWKLEITGKIYDIGAFDSRSSQLALLLGMLACRHHLPEREIYASGELNNTGELPRVEAVHGLDEKFNAILEHIERSRPPYPVLVALPHQYNPELPPGTHNDSSRRFARRLEAFRQQNRNIRLTVLYCDKLPEDLAAAYPRISHYRHWRRSLRWLPLFILLGLGCWQYQQPLYLDWGDGVADTPDSPLVARLSADNRYEPHGPCAQSTPGEAVHSLGDRMTMRIHINDASFWRPFISNETALVLVGENSDIRVENLPLVAGHPYYQTAYIITPPTERYLVMAIARRSRIFGEHGINKGTLSRKLKEHLTGLHGVERLTAAAGYLEAHYSSVQYRFRVDHKCKD